jgi:hypothetical protein
MAEHEKSGRSWRDRLRDKRLQRARRKQAHDQRSGGLSGGGGHGTTVGGVGGMPGGGRKGR